MQKKAYANEFLMAKKFAEENLEDDDDEVIKETISNTIYNLYVGKI